MVDVCRCVQVVEIDVASVDLVTFARNRHATYDCWQLIVRRSVTVIEFDIATINVVFVPIDFWLNLHDVFCPRFVTAYNR